MKRKTFVIILVVAILLTVLLYLDLKVEPNNKVRSIESNITYNFDGTPVAFSNGVSEELVPNSSEKITRHYFGNDVSGDLNGDNIADHAFIVTQSGSGSGTFFYLVVTLSSQGGFVGTNAVFLGDRIAPNTTFIRNGVITVNYGDRKPGEPFTAKPSIGISRHFLVRGTALVEIK